MKNIYIFYYAIALTILSAASFFPVVYNIYETKKSNNFTFLAIILNIISNLGWISYGIMTNTSGTLLMGLTFTIFYLYILYIKILY